MTIKQRFTIYNVLMLIVPVALIALLSSAFCIVFIMKYPVEELYITRAALLNPLIFTDALGEFIGNNPSALFLFMLWTVLCLLILIISTTLFTYRMAVSIQKPIKRLTEAADFVGGGNLDFDVPGSEYEEIDCLCSEFERMRCRLKATESEQKRMKEERSLLLANLSHDLRTPVTSIKGYIEGIRDGVAKTPEQTDKYLSTVYQKALVIESLVNNLSDYSKLETERMSFSFEDGDIVGFLKNFCDGFGLDLERNNIELTEDFPDGEYIIRYDGKMLTRAFTNLFDNAIKYKSEGTGHLYVGMKEKNDGVLIEISDDGKGIKAGDLNKVFNTFYRADLSRGEVKGSGLGLGIVKLVVERHGGRAWLMSDGENKGTTAMVFLPSKRDK